MARGAKIGPLVAPGERIKLSADQEHDIMTYMLQRAGPNAFKYGIAKQVKEVVVKDTGITPHQANRLWNQAKAFAAEQTQDFKARQIEHFVRYDSLAAKAAEIASIHAEQAKQNPDAVEPFARAVMVSVSAGRRAADVLGLNSAKRHDIRLTRAEQTQVVFGIVHGDAAEEGRVEVLEDAGSGEDDVGDGVKALPDET